MVASEQRRRTIERESKYQPSVRLPQHKEAKVAVVAYFRGNLSRPGLASRVMELRNRAASTNEAFSRDVLLNNADYIDRFYDVCEKIELPKAEILVAGPPVSRNLNGLKVGIEGAFRLKRAGKSGSRSGIATLRYQKGKALDPKVGQWQSALMWGMLEEVDDAENIADRKLVLTVDAYAGVLHSAPTDAKTRYKNMAAACTSIAQRWPSIEPPPSAVL